MAQLIMWNKFNLDDECIEEVIEKVEGLINPRKNGDFPRNENDCEYGYLEVKIVHHEEEQGQ